MSLKHARTNKGYDTEELYFEKLNRELINKIKEETKKETAPPAEQQTGGKVIPFTPRTKAQEKEKKAA